MSVVMAASLLGARHDFEPALPERPRERLTRSGTNQRNLRDGTNTASAFITPALRLGRPLGFVGAGLRLGAPFGRVRDVLLGLRPHGAVRILEIEALEPDLVRFDNDADGTA